ncbi:MAG: hypothetical protein PWP23_2329 [Candidatus Sumerlaeota bacterium]|nr:hypothetical protein [Candidatus Sumerlaeota bacterium]
MIHEVKVPSVGESIAEGLISKWNVAEGDYVEKGQELFDLDTDKATTEVPATESGVISLLVEEGAEVKVGSVVARIDTDAKAPAKSAPEKEKPAEAAPAAEKKPEPKQEEHDAEAGAHDTKVRASSVARKIAEEQGLDLSTIQGTGPQGRITREDVEGRIANAHKANESEAEPVQPAAGSDGDFTRVKMSMIRRRIAERLVEAQHTAAMLTTFNDVDMGAVMDLRKAYKESFKEKYGVGLGFMSFFTRAAAVALQDFPRVNSMIDGNEIITWNRQHIGIAVSTDKGLVVPVLRDAGNMTFPEIEKAVAAFAGKAREGRIELADMQGGTFTITNGGVFGSMLSTPILNPPQSAILGMHRIEERPVARNGQVVIRPMMYLALSYDHRMVDGREAVQFLVRIKQLIEDPARLLLGV